MAWTTPKTWTAATLTTTDMNTHVRDNLNALKTAQKITTSTKTTNTTFSNVYTTVITFSHTFDSGTTYVVEASWVSITNTTAAVYLHTARITVGGTAYAAGIVNCDGSSAQGGGSVRGVVSGVSGSQTVVFEVVASSGAGHTLNASATAPALVTIRPVDVV